MIRDSAAIHETVAASIHAIGRSGDRPVRAGDRLRDLGLTRLWLLAVLIELEDKFAIEFPPDAIDGFGSVGDITCYIRTHRMAPHGDSVDQYPIAA
jgi:acyl carrier protein